MVGASSPYLNQAIKQATTNADGTINTEANLIAHTVLGVLEAKATGNNALAGGVGAFTAEAVAPLVMKQLYQTENPADLTEKEKQKVRDLSQIAAGLSGGLVADSTAGVIVGAETGKRAVENNLLSQSKYQRLDELNAKLARGKKLTYRELEEVNALFSEDKRVDYLLKRNQSNPEKLSIEEKYYLAGKVNEIALEQAISNRSSVTDEKQLIYNWNYSLPQLSNDYRALRNELNVYNWHTDSFNYKMSRSMVDTISLISGVTSITGVAGVLNAVPKVGGLAMKYPATTENGYSSWRKYCVSIRATSEH